MSVSNVRLSGQVGPTLPCFRGEGNAYVAGLGISAAARALAAAMPQDTRFH